MSATITTFAIRYCVKGRVEVLWPKQSLSHEETQVAIGRIIDRAHKLHHVLDYIAVVPCTKRPGTKRLAEISRRTMDQAQLVHACNVYHRKAAAAAAR
jgi:hypothetical protein